MKALKSHPQTERPRRINSQITLARYTAGLVLALVGLISAGLMKGPIQLVSAETVALGWSYTGSLNTPRNYHTATLLPDGKVLVSGGRHSQLLDTAELFDPATGKWNATGSLNTPRSSYTATLLPDGKVLVAGGENYSGGHFQVLDSAELYDPATGKWNATGRLNGPSSVHAATLLKDGKVLIVGGYGGLGAELYDPQNERWSVTGGLNTPRLYHTATLLKNGKVLVVGPADAFFGGEADPLDTVELYDPDTGMWSFTGNLHTAVGSHTATLLQNGKVLVLGDGREGSAELYDPDTGEWSSTGHLSRARFFHTATLLPDGKVLVAGGWSDVANEFGYSFTLRSSELYDPDTETWSFAGNLNTPRGSHTATILPDGKPLLVGGYWFPGDGSTPGRYLDSVELGNPLAAFTPPKITMASVAGKKLIVAGENFDPDAVILINGEEQKTRNDDQNPGTTLIGKKAGKKIKPGDRLQVRNPDAPLSEEFIFTGS